MKKIATLKTLFAFALIFLVAGTQNLALATTSSEGVVETKLSNGISLFTKQTTSNISSLYIVIKGTCTSVDASLCGLPKLTLELMQTASEKTSAAQVRKFVFDTQSSFSAHTTTFGSLFGVSALNKYFDEALSMLLSMLTTPAFDENEYNLVIMDAKQALQQRLNEPLSSLMEAVNNDLLPKKDFATRSKATSSSINNITIDAMKAYHKTLLNASRICVVYTGSDAALAKKLNPTLGTLLQGESYTPQQYPFPQIDTKPVIVINESAKRAPHILRVFSMAESENEDYPAAKLASNIYDDVLFNIVRENYGVCYTPQSAIWPSPVPYGCELLYRTSDLKNFSIRLAEAREVLASGKVPSGRDEKGDFTFESLEDRLPGYLSAYINQRFQNSATSSDIALRLSLSLLQFNKIDGADDFDKKVLAVTAADIQRVFKKYWLSPIYKWYAVVAPSDKRKLKFE